MTKKIDFFDNTVGLTGISANGTVGTAGQVLKSNGTTTYWGADAASGGDAATLDGYDSTDFGRIAAINTWALAQTFTTAPVFTDASGSRTALGLGTAAVANTGTSGNNIPFLNGINTWANGQTFSSTVVFSNVPTINSANPIFQLYESDQAVDVKLWEHNVNSGIYTFRLVNDLNSAASTIFSVTRSTHVSSVFNFGSAVTLQLNGVAIPTISSSDILSNKTLASPLLSGQTVANNTSAGVSTTPFILRNASSTASTEVILQFNPASVTTRFAEIASRNDGINNTGLIFRTGAGGTVTDAISITGAGIVTLNSGAVIPSPALSGTISGSPTYSGNPLYSSATSFSPQVVIRNTNTDQYGGYLILDKAPSDNLLSASDALGVLMFRGVDTTGTLRNSAYIQATVQSQTATYVGSSLTFFTSAAGVVDRTEGGFNGGLTLGAPTGSNKGVGTLNATNIYVNDVLVPTISSVSEFTNKTINGGTFTGTIGGSPAFSGQPTFNLDIILGRTTGTNIIYYGAGSTFAIALAGTGNAFTINGSRVVNFPIAPTFTDAATTRTNLGLGTAAVANTGTSGNNVALLDGTNTWSNNQTFLSTTAGTTLVIGGAVDFAQILRISSNAGFDRRVNFFTSNTSGTTQRWSIIVNNVAESGSNAGSNFGIQRFDDTGAFIDQPLSIARNTGTITLATPTTISNTGTGALLSVTSSDAGAAAHGIDIFRNSASPAVNDAVGQVRFLGKDSGATTIAYGRVYTTIVDPTAGSLDSSMIFDAYANNVSYAPLTLGVSEIEHRFTTTTSSIVSSQGTNGYGSFYARGSGTNPAYMFFGNITSSERARITVNNAGDFIVSTNGGTANNFKVDSSGVLTANGNTIWHAGNDGDGTALDAGLLSGYNHLKLAYANRANRSITGGGTITVDASGNVLWSARFIVIASGRGTNASTTGYFDIECPTSGTITGVGGAGSVTATAAGIPLGAWQALYYILPIGSGNASLAANFRVASYTADVDIPAEWVLICVRNGDSGVFYFNNGIQLKLNGVHTVGTVWNSGNDGPGTGLDADLWDGNDFATYLNQAVKTTSSVTFSSVLTSAVYSPLGTGGVGTYHGFGLYFNTEWRNTQTGGYGFAIRNNGASGIQFVISTAAGTQDTLATTVVATLAAAAGTIWTSANLPTGTSGAVVPLLNGNNTYGGTALFSSAVTLNNLFTVSAASPELRLTETDASANETQWRITTAAGDFYLQALTDDYLSTTNPIRINRTGITIDSIALVSTALTWNGIAIPTISSTDTFTNKTLGATTVNALMTFTGTEGNQIRWTLGGQSWAANIQSAGDWYVHNVTSSRFPLKVTTASINDALVLGTTAAFGVPITSTGTISSTASTGFHSNYASGAQGGSISFQKGASGNTLAGNVTVDINGNSMRIYEAGGSFRGIYFDLTTMGSQSALATTDTTQTFTNKTFTTPVINGTSTGTGVATAATASTLVMRDANGDTSFRYSNATEHRIAADTLNRFMQGALVLRNGSPTVYFRDTDSNSAMIHCNSNILYVLRGANDTETWAQVNGAWPLQIDLTNNTTTVGGILQTSGTTHDMRSTVFYDLNNTAYYADPQSTSIMNNMNITTITMSGLLTGSSSASTDVNTANDTGSLSLRGNTSTIASMSFHRTGAYAVNMGLGTDNVLRIGGWSAANNCLQLDGSGNLTTLANITAYSDAKLKKDVETIDNAVDLVSRMRGVKYTRIDSGKRGVGVIAQEMLEVLPEVVQQGIGEDTTLSVAYGNIVGVLIEAIKEQQQQINKLEEIIKEKLCH